jgi:hypothetical protein
MTSQSFFGTLFDTSFSSFITTKFIRVLYVVLILMIGLGALFGVFGVSAALSEFMPWVIAFILALPVTAVIFLAYVILARIWLEIIIVVFRMAENIQKMADGGGSGAPGAGGAGPSY